MASLLPNVVQKFFNANGGPLAGGKLFSYVAGTSTPLATYTDQSAGTPNANPTILDANGSASIWIGSVAYKFVLKDANDVVQWTVDQVVKFETGSILTALLADGSVTTIKIADANVTTAKIQDGAVTSAKIQDGSITTSKIPNATLPIAKLAATAQLGFYDLLEGQFGGGIRATPILPWAPPTLIANPTNLPGGDGLGLQWNPSGGLLAVCENAGTFMSVYLRQRNTIKKIAGPDVAPANPAMAVAWSPDGQTLVAAIVNSPVVLIYQRAGSAMKLLSGPAVTPTGAGAAVSWSPNGDFLAVAHNTTPYMTVYQKSDIDPPKIAARYTSGVAQTCPGSFNTQINFETKSFDNASAVTIGAGWHFQAQRSDGYTINAVVSAVGGFTAGQLAKLFLVKNGSIISELDRFVAQATYSGEISLSGGDWLYLNANDTLSIYLYSTVASALGTLADVQQNHISIVADTNLVPLSQFTKLSNPATLPTGDAKAIAWSPDSAYLAVGHNVTPFVSIYSRSGTSLVKIANPSILPTSQVNGAAFSPDGQFLALVTTSSPYVLIYQQSGNTFTALSAPTTLPTGSGRSVCWHPTGDYLAIAHDTTPYVTIYSRSGNTFTKITDPTFLPAGNGKGVSWTPSGEFLSVSHTNTPYLTTYQTSGTVSSDAVAYIRELNLG